jgi:hypothetical protein
VSRVAQPLEEPACLLELLGARSLGEIAADDDEVGFLLVHALGDRIHEVRLVRAEMEVGQMDQASHDAPTRVMLNLFQGPFS